MEAENATRVSWEDVKPVAILAFTIWLGQPELVWAEKAWAILSDAKLTVYGTDLERYAVLFRILVLGGIYSDFCDAAWQEYSEPSYLHWAGPLELEPFLLGQLYARLPECECDENEALEILIENERSRVVAALLAAFGSVSELYASLWKSKDFEEPEDEGGGEDDNTYEPDAAQLSGYSWVDQGCERLR